MIAQTAAAADNYRISGSVSFTANQHMQRADSSRRLIRRDGPHLFYDNAGNAIRMSFTGNVLVTYTNLTTGATYSPNTSGPGTQDLATGQNVLRGGNGTLFDQDGNLIATDGRVVLDADFNIISITGHQTDVCARLDAG